MIYDISYCAEENCPFVDCMRHLNNLKGEAGIFTMSQFSPNCNTFQLYKGSSSAQDYYMTERMYYGR